MARTQRGEAGTQVRTRSRGRGGGLTANGQWSAEFLRGVLDASPEGIVVCESSSDNQPVVYANNAFERMSGYGADELVGHDLRRLQSWDRDQEGRNQLRAAISQGESCRVLLRN